MLRVVRDFLRNRRSQVRILSGALREGLVIPLAKGFFVLRRTPLGGNSGGNGATLMVLPLEPTDVPGVYRRGSRFVAVYRAGGRQHKESADTLADAQAIKLKRDGQARAERRGPTLHEFSLSWLERYAGSGHDSVRENTRRKYRRLLVNFDGRTRCRRQAAGVSRAPCALRARRCDGRRRGDSAWRAAAVAAKHVLDPAEPASPLERLAKARERGG